MCKFVTMKKRISISDYKSQGGKRPGWLWLGIIAFLLISALITFYWPNSTGKEPEQLESTVYSQSDSLSFEEEASQQREQAQQTSTALKVSKQTQNYTVREGVYQLEKLAEIVEIGKYEMERWEERVQNEMEECIQLEDQAKYLYAKSENSKSNHERIEIGSQLKRVFYDAQECNKIIESYVSEAKDEYKEIRSLLEEAKGLLQTMKKQALQADQADIANAEIRLRDMQADESRAKDSYYRMEKCSNEAEEAFSQIQHVLSKAR